MSTADAHTRAFAPSDRLEADLLDLFAVQPSAEIVDRLDARVERALRTWKPATARRPRLRVGRRAGLIGLLAATFAIGGATGSLQGLYFFLAGPFDVPWHRGEDIGLSQTVDGYTVTIDRAYADATRLALAISVVDELEREGTTQVSAYSTVVTDEAGKYGSGGGAMSRPDGPYAAVNVAWMQPAELPLPAGRRQLHVVLPFIQVRDDSTPPPNADAIEWSPWHRVAGPWTFDFEVVADGGTTVTPAAVAEIDGVRVSVPRLIAASGIVRVEMRIDGDLPPGDWSPIGEVSHGGKVLPFVVGDLDAGPDGMLAFMTDGGVANPSGEWTVTIKELINGNGEERLSGPWVLEFSAP